MSLDTSKLIRNVRRAPELLRAILATSQWFDLTAGYLRLKQPYPLVLQLRNQQRITLINRSDLATLWLVSFLLPTRSMVRICALLTSVQTSVRLHFTLLSVRHRRT